jgi:large subunit ribosomal protein L30
MADTQVRITQTKSLIGQSPRHRATMKTLGLRGIRKSVVRPLDESLAGQLRLVNHLVKVENAS